MINPRNITLKEASKMFGMKKKELRKLHVIKKYGNDCNRILDCLRINNRDVYRKVFCKVYKHIEKWDKHIEKNRKKEIVLLGIN